MGVGAALILLLGRLGPELLLELLLLFHVFLFAKQIVAAQVTLLAKTVRIVRHVFVITAALLLQPFRSFAANRRFLL